MQIMLREENTREKFSAKEAEQERITEESKRHTCRGRK